MKSISRLFVIIFILVFLVDTHDLTISGVQIWIWAKSPFTVLLSGIEICSTGHEITLYSLQGQIQDFP